MEILITLVITFIMIYLNFYIEEECHINKWSKLSKYCFWIIVGIVINVLLVAFMIIKNS